MQMKKQESKVKTMQMEFEAARAQYKKGLDKQEEADLQSSKLNLKIAELDSKSTQLQRELKAVTAQLNEERQMIEHGKLMLEEALEAKQFAET